MNTTNTRYLLQVREDRRRAAAERAEERRMLGQTTEDRINALYTGTL